MALEPSSPTDLPEGLARSNPSPSSANRERSRPTGTVTFLFTDIEGSVPLWERYPTAMKAAISRHHVILQEAVEEYEGQIFKVIGDAIQAAFEMPVQAIEAAIMAQRALSIEEWGETGPLKVRMGIHVGPGELIDSGDTVGGDYAISHTLNRTARIMLFGHGGQILLSAAVAELVQGQLAAHIQLMDLGRHTLKGMSQPEHIYQVMAPGLQVDFPPVVSGSPPRHNLPVQLTSFIGRQQEIREVKRLLEDTSLLTLTGVGGTGKTRLALQVAADLADEFEHGVWLVELASLKDEELILPTTAAIFRLRPETGRPLMDTVSDYLRAKRLLLVLDNCEHLVNGVAQFVHAILHIAARVKFLATSREALGLAGEMVYGVPSLSTPEPHGLLSLEKLAQYDAVKLFSERAHSSLPAFTLTDANATAVAQICQQLEGIPLAIELAAARVKVLSAKQIAARLDDRFRLLTGGSRTALPRHQTLRALIDWSYRLLAEEECSLFRRLSTFMGGWTLEAAEIICSGGQIEAAEVLDLLEGLVNKSLVVVEVQAGEVSRYRMLETIRQYAQERLLEAGEAGDLYDRHLDYYIGLAEQLEPRLRGAEQVAALLHLDTELDNLRAALSWALDGEPPHNITQGLRLTCALWLYWVFRNINKEGRVWIGKGLASFPWGEAGSIKLQAKTCWVAAYVAEDVLEARRLFTESISLYRQIGDQLGLAIGLLGLGNMLAIYDPIRPSTIDLAQAQSLVDESIAIFRKLGDKWWLAQGLSSKSYFLMQQGDYASARELCEESIELFKQVNDEFFTHFQIIYLALVVTAEGNYAAARECYQQSKFVAHAIKSKIDTTGISGSLGSIADKLGEYDQMETYYQEALTLALDIGATIHIIYYQRRLALAMLRQGKMKEAIDGFCKSLSYAQAAGDRYGAIAFVMFIAGVALAAGKPTFAARLLGAVEAQLETFFKPLDPEDQREYEQFIEEARRELGESKFAAAWAEGKAMTEEQAVHDAQELEWAYPFYLPA